MKGIEKTYLKSTSFQFLQNWSVRYLLEALFSYNEKFELVPIGSFLKRSQNKIVIENGKSYQRVTVKINNGGVFPRDIEIGENIGTKSQYRIKADQFLMSKIDARNGAFGLVPENLDGAIVTNDFPVFDVDNTKIVPEFLVLITTTKEFIHFAQSCSSGTTNRQRIDIESFLNVKIPLPSLIEQNRIVGAYNKKIKLAEELEKRAQNLRDGIDEFLFDVLGIKKLETSTRLNKFSTISYKEVERWSVDTLGKMSQIENNFKGEYQLIKLRELINSYQYGLSEKSSKEQVGFPMLRMNNINNSELDLQDLKYIKIDKNTFIKYKLNKGDLLFNRTNSKELVGKTALYDISGDYTFASYLIRVEINKEKADFRYINYLFNSLILQYQKDLISRQITGQANINAQEMQDFLFPFPPLEKQKEIADKIESIKEETKQLEIEALKSRESALKEFENEIFQPCN